MFTRLLQAIMGIVVICIIIIGIYIGINSDGSGGIGGLIFMLGTILCSAWIGAQVEMMANILDIKEMLMGMNLNNKNSINNGMNYYNGKKVFTYDDVRRQNGQQATTFNGPVQKEQEMTALEKLMQTENKIGEPWLCTKCKEKNSADSLFCQNCGNKR